MVETELVTFTVSADGETTTFQLPRTLVSMMGGPADAPPDVVADLTVMNCAERAFGAVHHSEGEVDAEIQAVEAAMLDLFEARFGAPFEDVTGMTPPDDDHGH